MKKTELTTRILCGAALFLAGLQGAACAAGPKADVPALVRGNNAFALDFYKKLGPGNLICSPYGVSEVFAMLQAGARGNTAAEINASFRFGAKGPHRRFAGLRAALAKTSRAGGVELNIADSVWPEKTEPPLPAFLKTLKKHYAASVTPLDYRRDPAGARKTINGWAERKTKGRIKDLLPDDAVGNDTRLVLVNAVYFKGLWESRFKKPDTKDQPFHAPGGDKNVPLMNQKAQFAYAEDEDAQILELPDKGREVSLLAVLPRPEKTLAQLEAALTPERLETWAALPARRKVQVWLPRFKTVSFYLLNDTLIALGVKDAFRPEAADLSGINGTGGLYVSKANGRNRVVLGGA
ncbi:MAG TPA: serpin family protein [Elusimicrobiales bacterium]|nr:serpin family protein [Elusimicrobiales bacterium]